MWEWMQTNYLTSSPSYKRSQTMSVKVVRQLCECYVESYCEELYGSYVCECYVESCCEEPIELHSRVVSVEGVQDQVNFHLPHHITKKTLPSSCGGVSDTIMTSSSYSCNGRRLYSGVPSGEEDPMSPVTTAETGETLATHPDKQVRYTHPHSNRPGTLVFTTRVAEHGITQFSHTLGCQNRTQWPSIPTFYRATQWSPDSYRATG